MTPLPSFFLYGTLKQGQRNAMLLAPFIMSVEDGTVDGVLYDLGEFPALIEGPGQVHGELVTVEKRRIPEILEVLDRLEGFIENDPSSSMYIRRAVSVRTGNGQAIAYAYFYNARHPALLPVNELQYLEEGIWTGPSMPRDTRENKQLQAFREHVRRFPATARGEEGNADNRGCE